MKNIIDSPLCRCNTIEFFLDCPIYNNQMITLMHVSVQLHWILCSTVIALSPYMQIVTSLKQYNFFERS